MWKLLQIEEDIYTFYVKINIKTPEIYPPN